MFKKIVNGCVRVVNRWLPDAFLFAVILTIVVFIGSMLAAFGGAASASAGYVGLIVGAIFAG